MVPEKNVGLYGAPWLMWGRSHRKPEVHRPKTHHHTHATTCKDWRKECMVYSFYCFGNSPRSPTFSQRQRLLKAAKSHSNVWDRWVYRACSRSSKIYPLKTVFISGLPKYQKPFKHSAFVWGWWWWLTFNFAYVISSSTAPQTHKETMWLMV